MRRSTTGARSSWGRGSRPAISPRSTPTPCWPAAPAGRGGRARRQPPGRDGRPGPLRPRRHRPPLSGGQRARLEILLLELSGTNLLLLDEPTDNLDLDSAVALERALEGFRGAVVAVSHDRAFLATLGRFVHVGADGAVHGVADWETALALLLDGSVRRPAMTRA